MVLTYLINELARSNYAKVLIEQSGCSLFRFSFPEGTVPDRKLPSLPDLAVKRAGVGGVPVAPLGGAAGDVSVSSRSTPEIISLVPNRTMSPSGAGAIWGSNRQPDSNRIHSFPHRKYETVRKPLTSSFYTDEGFE